MKFEWDEAKAIKNQKKHHVSFSLAALVFADPFVMTIHDLDHSDDEEREEAANYLRRSEYEKTL